MSRWYIQFAVKSHHGYFAVSFEDCSNGDVRLTGGHSDSDGTVEVCYNKIWGLIEVSGWGKNDAIVICRQLGFSTSSEWHKECLKYVGPSNLLYFFSLCLLPVR